MSSITVRSSRIKALMVKRMLTPEQIEARLNEVRNELDESSKSLRAGFDRKNTSFSARIKKLFKPT